MKLVDTNIFVDHLRGYEKAVEFFEKVEDGKVIFSAVTEAELVSGDSCSEKSVRQTILQFLQNWEKVEVTNPVAVKAGDLRREHEILLPDAIIAATSLHRNAELVTRDTSDFRDVEELKVRKPYS